MAQSRLCAAALLLALAEGRRVVPGLGRASQLQVEDSTPDVKKLFAASDMTICGGSAIRDFLTAPKSADEVRNIPWSQVDAVADEFIRDRTAEIARLGDELKRLQALIPEREKAEAPKPMANSVITANVENAVRTTGSYGSLQVAIDSKCGAVMFRPRPPTRAFMAAVDSFRTAIQSLLKDGKTSVRSQVFADVCYAQMAVKAGDLKSNCDELCLEFAAAAQAASDAAAGALAVNGKSSDQLRREAEATASLIKQAQADREGCVQTKADIAVFEAQLSALQEDVTEKHGKLMGARDALMDAQYDLMDAEDSVAAQQAETQKTAKLLEQAGAVVDAVLVKVKDAEAKTNSARSALNATQKEYAEVQLSLKSAQGTSGVVMELKAAVSDSMMKMVLYFDEAVRRPVRLMGLGDDVKVDSLFPELVTALDSAKATRSSMEALNTFCSREETRRALAAGVADGVDPRELCSIGDVPSIEKDIDNTVAQSINTVKGHLAQVQSWLDPYKGQSAMNRELVLANIQQGELVGLREVITAFGSTSYYRQYLQHWQLKGRFQDIIKALSDALKRSEDANTQATAKLGVAREQLAACESALQEAANALDGAIKAKKFVQGMNEEAEAALASLQAAAAKVKQNVEALEAAVRAAEARYQEARTALETTHKEGVSLVELLQELEAADQQRVSA